MALLQQERGDTDVEEKTQELAEETPMSAGDPVAMMAAGSVLLAWYQFYIKGEKQTGIFVGLWAPTMLAGASYLQQKDIIRRFKKGLSSF